MIHDEICTYEVAKLAKEKGFPIECNMFYNRNGKLCDDRNYDSFDNEIWCYAPTQSLLQRWLREVKRINISIDSELDFNEDDYIYEWQLSNKKDLGDGCFRIITESDMEFYPNYEEALEAAIKHALENWI